MKKEKVPSLVTLAILTALTIVFWVGFSVFRTFTTKEAADIPPEILEPISPTLEKETLGKIEGSIFFEDSQIRMLVSSPSAAPTASPSATPEPGGVP